MFNFKVITFFVLIFSCVAAQASEDIGNWYGEYSVGHHHQQRALHTPSRVCLEGFCAGNSLRFGAHSRINGLQISDCGLTLRVKMSRQDFESALMCAGLNPIPADGSK